MVEGGDWELILVFTSCYGIGAQEPRKLTHPSAQPKFLASGPLLSHSWPLTSEHTLPSDSEGVERMTVYPCSLQAGVCLAPLVE